MSGLPAVSGRDAERALLRLGWRVHRRESIHVPLYKPGEPQVLTIPAEGELCACVLGKLLAAAGVSEAEFSEALLADMVFSPGQEAAAPVFLQAAG